MGTEKRPDIGGNPVKQAPGPGNYAMRSAAFTDKPHFYIGQKLQDQSKMNVPGAGTYEPRPKMTQSQGPFFSMGLKLKGDLIAPTAKVVPGPGAYTGVAENTQKAAPRYGFGSSKRGEMAKMTGTPGPGSYKLPTKVADVQAFALPNQKAEYKFV